MSSSPQQFQVGRQKFDNWSQAASAALGHRRCEVKLPEHYHVTSPLEIPPGMTIVCHERGSTLTGSNLLIKASGRGTGRASSVLGELTLDSKGGREALEVAEGATLNIEYVEVKSAGLGVVVHGVDANLVIGDVQEQRRSRRHFPSRHGGSIRATTAIALRNHGSLVGRQLAVRGHVAIATSSVLDLANSSIVGQSNGSTPGVMLTGRGSKCCLLRCSVDAFKIAYVRVTGGGHLASKECSYGLNTQSGPANAIELRHDESSASLHADRIANANTALLHCSYASVEALGVKFSKASIGIRCKGKAENGSRKSSSFGVVLLGEGCEISQVSTGLELGIYTRSNISDTVIRTWGTSGSTGIMIAGGMAHCRLHSKVTVEESSEGIVVVGGAKLEALGSVKKQCVVSGCSVGVECSRGGNAELTNIILSSNDQHVQLKSGGKCTLNGCTTEQAQDKAFVSEASSMLFIFGCNICDRAGVLPQEGSAGIAPAQLYSAGAYNVALGLDPATFASFVETNLRMRLDWVAEVCLDHSGGEEVAVTAMKELYNRCDYRRREILVGKEDRRSSLFLGMIGVLPYEDLLLLWKPGELDLAPLALLEEVSMIANGGSDEQRVLAVEGYSNVEARVREAPETYVDQYVSLLRWHHPAAWRLFLKLESYANEDQHRDTLHALALSAPTLPTALRGSWVQVWAGAKLFTIHAKSYSPESMPNGVFVAWCDYMLDQQITQPVDEELERRYNESLLKESALVRYWERLLHGARGLTGELANSAGCLRKLEDSFCVADALPGPLRRIARELTIEQLFKFAKKLRGEKRYELLVCMLFEHISPDGIVAPRAAKGGSCPSCFRENLEPSEFFVLANCKRDHSLCISCTHSTLEVNKNTKLQCPGDGKTCGAHATRSDLLRLFGEKEAMKMIRGQVEAVLMKTNGRQACTDTTCGIGAIVEPGKQWFECVSCRKMSSLSGIDVDPYIASQLLVGFQSSSSENGDKVWRECYFCSSVIVKGASCSTLTCANCYEQFDFVYGNRSEYRKVVGQQESHAYDMSGVAPQHYYPRGNSLLAKLGLFANIKQGNGVKFKPGDVLHPIKHKHLVVELCRRAREELARMGWV